MTSMTESPDRGAIVGIEVDGRRPAVEWVTSLPRGWVTSDERLILLALACDSYDGVDSAPGWIALAAWTGMYESSLREIVGRLEKPKIGGRPALLRRDGSKGRRRVSIALLQPNLPVSPAGSQPAGQPAGEPAGDPAGVTGTSLSLALAPKEEEEAERLRDAIADLIGELDRKKARAVRTSPKVLARSVEQAAKGFTAEDVRKTWNRKPVNSVECGGVGLALKILDGLGKPLKTKRTATTRRGSSTAPRTAADFACALDDPCAHGCCESTADGCQKWWGRCLTCRPYTDQEQEAMCATG